MFLFLTSQEMEKEEEDDLEGFIKNSDSSDESVSSIASDSSDSSDESSKKKKKKKKVQYMLTSIICT